MELKFEARDRVLEEEFSDVLWQFRVDSGIWASIRGVDIEDDDDAPEIRLPALFILPLVVAGDMYWRNPKNLPKLHWLYWDDMAVNWSPCFSGITALDKERDMGWWLSKEDLHNMWKLTKRYRPDIAESAIKFAQELLDAHKGKN